MTRSKACGFRYNPAMPANPFLPANGAATPAAQVLSVSELNRMAREFDTAIIVVTHDEKIIPTFRRIYHIRDGRTHEEAGEGRSIE